MSENLPFFGGREKRYETKPAPRTGGVEPWPVGQNCWVYLMKFFFKFRGWSLRHEDFRCVTVSLEILFFYIGPPTLGLQNPWKMRIERPNKYGTRVITPKYEGCEFPWHEVTHASTKKRYLGEMWVFLVTLTPKHPPKIHMATFGVGGDSTPKSLPRDPGPDHPKWRSQK